MSEEQAEPRRVLVAEDEGLIRLDIVETLTQAGFEVVGEAADGEEAVELALELEPDLCVMDVCREDSAGAVVRGRHADGVLPDGAC